jgi:hypothetical protein
MQPCIQKTGLFSTFFSWEVDLLFLTTTKLKIKIKLAKSVKFEPLKLEKRVSVSILFGHICNGKTALQTVQAKNSSVDKKSADSTNLKS